MRKILVPLILFLLLVPIANAQEVLLTPPNPDNSQIQKASTGAPFNPGWNYFSVGVDGCTTLTVLNELQADGGSALNVDNLFVKDFFNWNTYNFQSPKQKKLGSGDVLAFNSNQKFFLQIDEKTCSSTDSSRQAQIDKVRGGATAKNSLLDKVSEMPVDLWTKLTNLLNQDGAPAPSTNNNKQNFDSLTIGGKTTVNDLGITGKVTAGLLTINGFNDVFATLNTLSNDLYLQNEGLGGVNILSGKVVIDKDGNLTVLNTINTGKIEADQFVTTKAAGSSILPANNASVNVTAQNVNQNSRILITPTTITDKVLVVTQKQNGKFTVGVKQADNQDIHFDWFIVQ